MSDRRPLRFWQPFNDWWRGELAKLGRRPNAQEIVDWYHHNAPNLWGNDAPSIQETRVHAKCLRSLPLVRDYFRTYRAKKRGGDRSGPHDSEGGSPSKRRRRGRAAKQMTSEEEEEEEGDEDAGQEEREAGNAHDAVSLHPGTHMPMAHFDMRAMPAHAAPALDYFYKPSRMPGTYRHDPMVGMAHVHDPRLHMGRAGMQQFPRPWSHPEVAAHQQQELVRNYMMMQAQQNVAHQQQAALAALSQQYAANRAAAKSSQSSSALANSARRMATEMHPEMARQAYHVDLGSMSQRGGAALGSPQARRPQQLDARLHRANSIEQTQQPLAVPIQTVMLNSKDRSRRQPCSSEDAGGYACLDKLNPLAQAQSGQQSPVAAHRAPPLPMLSASPRPNQQLATASPRDAATPRQKQQLEMLSKGQLMDLVMRLQQQKQQGSPRPSPVYSPSTHPKSAPDVPAVPLAKRHDIHSPA